MKRLTIATMAVCAHLLLASTAAFAQTTSSGNTQQPAAKPAGQNAQGMQPGKEGDNMSRAAAAGNSASGNEGALMQQRQNAMSPQGASGGNATGKMKQ
jgi:hypothetical protein